MGRTNSQRAPRDVGQTLIEILIAIVLMGTAVTAVLVSVRTTTAASAVDEEHAISFAWLQAASDEIYRIPRLPCDGTEATRLAIIANYSAAIQPPNVPKPDSWPGAASASIAVTNLQFLGKVSPDDEYEWGDSYCLEGGIYANSPQYTQRVTIQATSPTGMVKTLQMVKGKS